MKKNTLMLVLLAGGITILGAFFYGKNSTYTVRAPNADKMPLAADSSAGSGSSNAAAATVDPQPLQAKQKFKDSQYYDYAYLVSGISINAAAREALAGFDVSRQVLADGKIKITLKALEARYRNQSYTLSDGQKLYFIETSFGDDSGDREYALSDDTAIIVDKDGYIAG